MFCQTQRSRSHTVSDLGIETEIHELESLEEAKLDQSQKARLKELRVEVERVRKIKQDYVAAHPEQAHLVRGLEQRPRRQQDAGSAPSASMCSYIIMDYPRIYFSFILGGNTPAARSLFGKNGLPVHPERSLYYDPVMNPYGMPPPGMPYAERGNHSSSLYRTTSLMIIYSATAP